MTRELEEYIWKYQLCKTENLFEDWEAFVDFLFAQGASVESVLWFEHIPVSEQKGYLRPDKYPDPADPQYLYQETPEFQDELEEKTREEIKAYIRSVREKSPDRELVPCFYLYDKDAVDLVPYDNKCVRISDRWGGVFEGICMHNSRDYNKHEFGRFEEGLQMPGFLFFQSDILKVESLEEHQGPYGKFSGPYGQLEEIAVEDGPDLIDELLFCEDPEHVIRMLRCLDDYLEPKCEKELHEREKTIGLLQKLAKETDDEAIRKEAERLITKAMTNE